MLETKSPEMPKTDQTDEPDVEYLQILENYGVKWNFQKIARDIWQNFYDSNNFTVEGIKCDISFNKSTGEYDVMLFNDANFDYRRLLHLGGGEKTDPQKAAGGKAEGTKMFSLQLLRDYGLGKVTFGSRDWELDFTLESPDHDKHRIPDDEFKLRGLFATIKKKEKQPGNYIKFTLPDEKLAEEFRLTKNLFFSKENPDFKYPTLDNDRGGFRYLGNHESGHFYLNGQRICYSDRDSWEVYKFDIWTKQTPSHDGKELDLSRDRDLVTQGQMENVILPFILKDLDPKEAQRALEDMSAEWLYREDTYSDMSNKVVGLLVQCLVDDNVKMHFDPKYLSCPKGLGKSERKLFKEMGIILCWDFFKDIGMPSALEHLKEIENLSLVEPNESEKKRIKVLESAASSILAIIELKTSMGKMLTILGEEKGIRSFRHNIPVPSLREIQMYSGAEHPAEGVFSKGKVWIARHVLEDEFNDALMIYLHELFHVCGRDDSKGFSTGLTVLAGMLIEYSMKNPNALVNFDKEWRSIKIDKKKISDYPDFKRTLEKIFGEEDSLISEDDQLTKNLSAVEDLAVNVQYLADDNPDITIKELMNDIWSELSENSPYKKFDYFEKEKRNIFDRTARLDGEMRTFVKNSRSIQEIYDLEAKNQFEKDIKKKQRVATQIENLKSHSKDYAKLLELRKELKESMNDSYKLNEEVENYRYLVSKPSTFRGQKVKMVEFANPAVFALSFAEYIHANSDGKSPDWLVDKENEILDWAERELSNGKTSAEAYVNIRNFYLTELTRIGRKLEKRPIIDNLGLADNVLGRAKKVVE